MGGSWNIKGILFDIL